MKKIIFATIIGLFGVASVADATALTQQQIDSILGLLRSFGTDTTVVANVESALTGKTVPAAPAAWCHSFNINLKFGDSTSEKDGSGDVKELQQALIKEGFTISSSEHNGRFINNFGESTASAVVAFQEKYRSEILTPNGLSHGTGYVGPATRKKLNQLYGCSNIVKMNPPLSDWESYNWSGISFQYPANWIIEKSYYRTPAQEAEGSPAEVVGLYVKPKNQISPEDVIGIGGRQFNCETAGPAIQCKTLIGIPFYTQSKNTDVLKTFEALTSSVMP
ncbi:MAG: peptidoglycan-binding domain-containing protein [Patescibacteria group bacterium]